MSNGSAFVMTISIVAADVLLVVAARTIDREPFRTLDRILNAAWQWIYRATGAQALDRRFARRSAGGDVAMFTDLAQRLDAAGLAAATHACRDAAGRSTARMRG